MSSTSAACQQKFTTLRRRLDQLGYRQPLGIESLPLVERLFADLIHTTESLKQRKLTGGRADSTEKGSLEAHVEPYRSDNAKLVKENNELHQQLICTREELEASNRELKTSLRKLEHENADLRFLNNQYVHKVRALEKDSKQKTDRILQLQEKNFHAVVQTPGGRKKNIPFRRQRMEIDCMVPPSDRQTPSIVQPEDPYVADLLMVADDKIEKLKQDLDEVCRNKTNAEDKIKNLRCQLETRDNEIDRLSRMLEGGRPYDVVALEARNRSNERLISHLNIQVDYLQQRNGDLQTQLDDAISQARKAVSSTADLDTRNLELERELEGVDRLAQQLQLDKESALKQAANEVESTRHTLIKTRKDLTDVDMESAKMKAELDTMVSEMSGAKKQLSEEKQGRAELEALLERIQDDKRKLGLRVNKLLANERELVLEIDRLKHRKAPGKKKKSDHIQNFMKTLEEDRDYWKSECDILQKLIKSKSRSRASSPALSRSRSPKRSRSLQSTPSKKGSRGSTPVRAKSSSADKLAIAQYEALMQTLEDERDHYKHEAECLRALKKRPQSPSRLNANEELTEVIKERDELQRLLNKFERHMAEIQGNIKVLTLERDKISDMYESTNEELNRVRRDIVRSPKSAKTSLAAQAVLRRVENERDDAMAELRRMSTERDSLRERLKIATDTHLSDRARLEQQLEDAESNLRSMQRSRNDLEEKALGLQRTVTSMEDRINTMNSALTTTEDEALSQKSTATQMRMLAEQSEESLEQVQQQLKLRESELCEAEDKVIRLEQRLSEMNRLSNEERDESARLRNSITSLDREKDKLQMEVDDRTEKIVQLENVISEKSKIIESLRLSAQELQDAVEMGSDSNAAKEREVRSLRRQLDDTCKELSEINRSRESALRENRRLHDDLATMTKENQSVTIELEDALEERQRLKQQMQDYINDVKRIEELLSTKEQERSDLLDQYRSLSLEAERYETQYHQLESESSNMRLELMTRDSEIRRLREKLDSMDKDLGHQDAANQSYEIQVSNLTKSVANLEESLRVVNQEKQLLMEDLTAVRDLCAKVEISKEHVQKELTAKTMAYENLQMEADDLRQATGVMKTQLSSERSAIKNLETLLHSNRDKEFQATMTETELSSEINLLRDKLALNETKLESHLRDISSLRTRNMELDSEVERLRRQLTNERFERDCLERAVQELRRHGVNAPGDSFSRYSLGSPSRNNSNNNNLTTSPGRSRSKSPGSRSRLDDPMSSVNIV